MSQLVPDDEPGREEKPDQSQELSQQVGPSSLRQLANIQQLLQGRPESNLTVSGAKLKWLNYLETGHWVTIYDLKLTTVPSAITFHHTGRARYLIELANRAYAFDDSGRCCAVGVGGNDGTVVLRNLTKREGDQCLDLTTRLIEALYVAKAA